MLKKIICWLLVLIWLVVIFCFSSKNGETSDKQSKAFIIETARNTVKVTNELGITNKELTDKELHDFASDANYVVRKLAHFSIYLVLAILVMVALSNSNWRTDKKIFLAILICFLYSITDEFHQMFISGRSGMAIDCVIDTFGGILGCVIYALIGKIFKPHKRSGAQRAS